MALFLHGFIARAARASYPLELAWLDDMPFCMSIDEWEIVPETRVVTREPMLLVKTTSEGWGGGKTEKPVTALFLLRPGCRYHIVANNPQDCQPPNGTIVWRWEG